MTREPEELTEIRCALGAQLATFRTAAKLTQGQLAKAVFRKRTIMTHIEKGRTRGDNSVWKSPMSDAAPMAPTGRVPCR